MATPAAIARATSSQPEKTETPAVRSRPAALIGAALAFAAGIVLGSRFWRPPVWWFVAALLVLAASMFFYRRRPWLSRLLSVIALMLLGALNLELRQISAPHIENDTRFARIIDGREVVVEGHALRDGVNRPSEG